MSSRDNAPADGRDAQRPRLTDVKPGEQRSSEQAGEVNAATADDPRVVREEVANTADSSGHHSGDEAGGQVIKEQLKRGMKDVRPMD